MRFITTVPPGSARMRLSVTLLLAGTLSFLAGCPGPQPGAPEPGVAPPLAGSELSLIVVDDPAIARSAERLRGEWNSQTGGGFSVTETTAEELLATASLPGDAVILPSALLGAVAEREETVPSLPRALVAGFPDEQRGEWSDVFEALRRGEAVWGAKEVAVPFGSPVFVCYYRADLLEQLDRPPPRTWDEYPAVARLLAEANPGTKPWHGAVEPLGPGWAGLVLLARAAPYARHRENYSVWFDIQTMAPLIAGPPLVRALEELVEAAKLGPADTLELDPDGVRRAFWAGRAGMALTWPTAAADDLPPDLSDKLRAGFAELPGSTEVYNVSRNRWDERLADECLHVPLLSIAGRLGTVTRGSAHAEAAQELLMWLSGSHWSPTVCAKSPATTLFRQEHVSASAAWVEPPASSDAAARYAAVTAAALGRRVWVTALRIPGREAYLAALDQAVHAAVRGEATPQEALDAAAESWRATTDSLGLDRQRTAYRRSLGFE